MTGVQNLILAAREHAARLDRLAESSAEDYAARVVQADALRWCALADAAEREIPPPRLVLEDDACSTQRISIDDH